MLAEKVKKFISANGLFTENDSLLVAFSGGADSMCLLHILKSLSYNVSAAHLNHMLRGEEADRDEKTAKEFCEKLGIPFYCFHADVASVAKTEGISVETAGRRERYNFFSRIASEKSIDKIVTAHNLNDNVETVLMHIFRGCSTDGLSGIPKIRDNIVRPLLCCSRSEIEEYCHAHNLPYVTDSTNLENLYTRNKIRLELLPAMSEFNPAILSALANLSETALSDKEFFATITTEICGEKSSISISELEPLHNAVLYRVISKLAENADISCEFCHIKKVAEFIRTGLSGKKIYVPGGYFEFSCGTLSALKETPGEFCYKIHPDSEIELENYSISTAHAKSGDVSFRLPADGEITIRSRLPGDKIRVRGMTKKLSDVFIDRKIPANKRNTIPLLTLNGEIIYIFGLEKSDFKIDFENIDSTFVLNISNKEYTNEQ